MAYELPLDPEDCPLTPEWEEERALRHQQDVAWLESLDTNDLDTDVRYCRRASHR